MERDRDIAIRLESDGFGSDDLVVQRVIGHDRINSLFEYAIYVTRDVGTVLDADDVLIKPASLVFAVDGEEIHRLYGMVSEVRDVAEPQLLTPKMEMRFVPRSYSTKMRETLDIFMEVSVPEIIEACLQRCGLEAGEHYDIGGLTESYEPREFVVQYKETDFAFISRLCEHQGIFFFVDHSSGKDVLTFGDDNSAFPTLMGSPTIPFNPARENAATFAEHVGKVDVVTRTLPKRYTVRDYNYRIPGVDLLASSDVDPSGLGEIVEYGAHFKGPNEGQRIADIRSQELIATKRVWTGVATAPSLCAGSKFMLVGHPLGDTELLVTEVQHEWAPDRANGDLSTTLVAILAEVPYRPPRLTPKPRINGLLTGMIDAGVRDDYADLDDQGRYRVRFMYDTAERGEGQASRLVRMAQPHGGTGFGMHFPLRPNTEVTIACIDGDPDRPIITGMVPNPETMSPVTAANRDRNVISTGGGNKIDLSDEGGVERIKLTTPFMGATFQLGAPNAEEEGGVFTSSANFVAQTADTIASGSEFVSSISDLIQAASGSNVVSVAGLPSPAKVYENFEKFYKATGTMVKSLDKLAETATGTFGDKKSDEKKLKEAKKEAEDAIIAHAATPTPTFPKDARKTTLSNGLVVRETEAQFRARMIEQGLAATPEPEKTTLKTAVDNTSGELGGSYAADWWPEKKKGWAGDVAAGYEAGEKILAAAKPLFSAAHKAAQKAFDATAFAKAEVDILAANKSAATSAPRGPMAVMPAGPYYHLNTGVNAAILNGWKGVYAVAGLDALVQANVTTTIAANVRTSVFGGAYVEMAAQTAKMTGTLLTDVHSRQRLEMSSGNDTNLTVGDKLTIKSKDDAKIETEKKMFVKAVNLFDLDGGDHAKLKAKKWKLDSTDAEVAIDVKGEWNAKVTGKVTWNHNDKVKIVADGTELKAEVVGGGMFKATKSFATIEQQGGGASVVVNSSGATIDCKEFSVYATKIELNGKVLLG